MGDARVVRRALGKAPKPGRKQHPPPQRPLPRVTRLLALAIYLDDLIRRGEVKDYAEIARIGRVSRARVTQIMDLLNLAPRVQEILLDDQCQPFRMTERALRSQDIRHHSCRRGCV